MGEENKRGKSTTVSTPMNIHWLVTYAERKKGQLLHCFTCHITYYAFKLLGSFFAKITATRAAVAPSRNGTG